MAAGWRGLLEFLGLWPSVADSGTPPTVPLDGTFQVVEITVLPRITDQTRVLVLQDKQVRIPLVDRTHTRTLTDGPVLQVVFSE